MRIDNQLLRENLIKVSDACDGVVNTLKYQVLANADSLIFQLVRELNLDDTNKKRLEDNIELMIKSPIRKQSSRIMNVVTICSSMENALRPKSVSKQEQNNDNINRSDSPG